MMTDPPGEHQAGRSTLDPLRRPPLPSSSERPEAIEEETVEVVAAMDEHDDAVAEMVAMGFDAERASAALEANDYSVERSVEYLLCGGALDEPSAGPRFKDQARTVPGSQKKKQGPALTQVAMAEAVPIMAAGEEEEETTMFSSIKQGASRTQPTDTERTSAAAKTKQPGYFQLNCRISKTMVIWVLLALLICAFVVGGICGAGKCGASDKTAEVSLVVSPSEPSPGPVSSPTTSIVSTQTPTTTDSPTPALIDTPSAVTPQPVSDPTQEADPTQRPQQPDPTTTPVPPPTPQPTDPQPVPQPIPVPQPTLQPTDRPEPVPVPQPTLQPTDRPEPVPVPQPTPQPVPQPVPTPQPVSPPTPSPECDIGQAIEVDEIVATGTSSFYDTGIVGCSGANVGSDTMGVLFQVEGTGESLYATTCVGEDNFHPLNESVDTAISVLTGTDCNNLVCIGGNDDDDNNPCGTEAGVRWQSQSGKRYFILAQLFRGAGGTFGVQVKSQPYITQPVPQPVPTPQPVPDVSICCSTSESFLSCHSYVGEVVGTGYSSTGCKSACEQRLEDMGMTQGCWVVYHDLGGECSCAGDISYGTPNPDARSGGPCGLC